MKLREVIKMKLRDEIANELSKPYDFRFNEMFLPEYLQIPPFQVKRLTEAILDIIIPRFEEICDIIAITPVSDMTIPAIVEAHQMIVDLCNIVEPEQDENEMLRLVTQIDDIIRNTESYSESGITLMALGQIKKRNDRIIQIIKEARNDA